MHRRGFLKGLGALLATSAMVKPAAADVFFAVDTATAGADASVFWLSDDHLIQIVSPTQWSDLMTAKRDTSAMLMPMGYIGEWKGFEFIETPALTHREMMATVLGEPWFRPEEP